MSAYENIVQAVQLDKDEFQRLKQEWAEEMVYNILYYKEIMHVIRKVNNSLKEREYFPPITNFRDALFHYKIAYESDSIVTLIEQNNSIMEHLHRALKDGLTEIIRTLTNEISEYYENNKDDDTKVEENLKLQRIIHMLKEKELEIRLYSLEIQRIFENMSYFETFVELIENIKSQLSSDKWFEKINQKLTFKKETVRQEVS